MSGVWVVGTGLAGHTLARELRKLRPEVEITLVTRDAGDFYSKPALSNAVSAGLAPERDLFDAMSIHRQIKAAFAKQVMLKSGAYLIVEQTEAMHVIDVNSGGRKSGAKDQEENALMTNLEVVDEVADEVADEGGSSRAESAGDEDIYMEEEGEEGLGVVVRRKPPRPLWSHVRTMRVSAVVFPLFFVANFAYNLSLAHTSVTSNTIISTTASLWTFLFR